MEKLKVLGGLLTTRQWICQVAPEDRIGTLRNPFCGWWDPIISAVYIFETAVVWKLQVSKDRKLFDGTQSAEAAVLLQWALQESWVCLSSCGQLYMIRVAHLNLNIDARNVGRLLLRLCQRATRNDGRPAQQ